MCPVCLVPDPSVSASDRNRLPNRDHAVFRLVAIVAEAEDNVEQQNNLIRHKKKLGRGRLSQEMKE